MLKSGSCKILDNLAKYLLLIVFFLSVCSCGRLSENKKVKPVNPENNNWENLIIKAGQTGKPDWQPMLKYVAELHRKSTHPATYPFNYEWEEIGPGYIYGPAFGHWDIIHQVLM